MDLQAVIATDTSYCIQCHVTLKAPSLKIISFNSHVTKVKEISIAITKVYVKWYFFSISIDMAVKGYINVIHKIACYP